MPPQEESADEVNDFIENTLFEFKTAADAFEKNVHTNSVFQLSSSLHVSPEDPEERKDLYICPKPLKEEDAIGHADENAPSSSDEWNSEEDEDVIDDESSDGNASAEVDPETKVFTPMIEDETSNVQRAKVRIRGHANEEDWFMIVRVSSEEVRDVLFLQSGLTPMKEYISALREEEDERPAEDLASGVQDILAQMIFFITDTQENNPYMCEGIPRRERQKLMRELRIVDLLIDMIYFPFEENGLYSIESIPSGS